jgi:hypothetical protein
MNIRDIIEDLRQNLPSNEAMAYTRLPNGSPVFLFGGLQEVRERVAHLLQKHETPQLPVVIMRITDHDVGKLHATMDRINTPESVSHLSGGDVVLLRELFANPETEEWDGDWK